MEKKFDQGHTVALTFMDSLSNFPNIVMKSSGLFVKIVSWIVSMKSDSRKDEFISHLNYTRNIEAMVSKLPMQECLKVDYKITKGDRASVLRFRQVCKETS